jgi:hypothetical protein
MRPRPLLLLAAVALLAATGTAVAADNTAPMADAGVDQTVVVNSTVYLDGNASVDPDGEITAVSWSIERPDGETISPDCADCRRTAFDATALGQYTVTLTVTDDDGATRSDTLYVTTATDRGPDVSVSGPNATAPGSTATVTATVSADQASLESLAWLVNGSVVERTSLDGASANHSFSHSFDEAVPVRAVVYDTLGNRGSATHRVSVRSRGSGNFQCLLTACGGTGADATWTEDGVTTITDTNDKEGLQTYDDDGNLVTIKNPDENPKIERRSNAGYRIEGGLSSLDDDAFTSNDDGTDESSGSGSPSSSDGSSLGDSANSAIEDAQDTIDSLLGGGSDDGGSSSDDDSGGGGGGWLGGGLL